jgi:putative colanic acid biosynthesis UDP-glucose lipid carrier transferase
MTSFQTGRYSKFIRPISISIDLMVILVLGSWFFQRPEFEDEYFFHVSGSLLGNHCFFFIDFTGFIALRLTRNTIKNCSAKCTFLLVTFFHFQQAVFF